MKFAMGSLDKPVSKDKPFIMPEDFEEIQHAKPGSRSKLMKTAALKASVEGRIYPDFMNYRYAARLALNQNPYGICYITTACNFAKFVVWLHTGKLLPITRDQAVKVAEIARGSKWNEGGYYENGTALLSYTDTDCECITKFKQICSARGITSSNLLAGSSGCTKSNAIKTLNNYGPFYWGHGCHFYYPGAQPGEDGHAILCIGYDTTHVYFKNSWSSNDSVVDNTDHYAKFTWKEFEDNGRIIGAYSAKIWKDL